MDTAYQPTARTTPTRYRERARYDRRAVHDILDEALICHLGYLNADRPVVLPTTHARLDETLYLHGSTGSGPLLAARAAEASGRAFRSASPSPCWTAWCWHGPRCTTRSTSARSSCSVRRASSTIRPRSHGAELPARPHRAGARRGLPGPDARELAATGVLALDLVEVSAKVRSGPRPTIRRTFRCTTGRAWCR